MQVVKINILLLLLLCTGYAYSQPIDATIKSPGYLFINNNVEYISSDSIIPVKDMLLQRIQQKFKKIEGEEVIYKGYEPYHYWYRFSIFNKEAEIKSLILLMGQLGIRNAEIWRLQNDSLVLLGKTGYEYHFQSRPYLFSHYAFPVSISPQSIDTFYINMDESHAYKVDAFALIKPNVMKRMENRFYFLFGIFTGILLFFAITNIYLFFSIREKIHLWYSFYILTLLFFMFKHEGLDSQFLGLDTFYGYRSSYMGAVAILGVGLLMHVMQKFLTNIPARNKLYRFTAFVKWCCWIGAFIQWTVFLIRPENVVEKISFVIFNTITLIALLLIFVNCIYSFIKGFKSSLFIFMGLAVFLVGAVTRTLFISTKSYIFPPSLFEIGLVAEAVIVSFGLMYRYNLFKKEKEQYALELEKQSAEAARQILLTQEAEQKRIALDLHDELGGNLAAIKMSLQSFDLPEQQLDAAKKLIDKASNNARFIAHNLMPPEFEQTELSELLKNYYQDLSNENVCKFRFYSSGSNHHFDKQQDLMIYRIFMELSNNILKHAKATDATLQLIYYDTYLELMAEDNGTWAGENDKRGIGMKNIHSRVNYLKGKINIDSGRHGTTIMIQIPF